MPGAMLAVTRLLLILADFCCVLFVAYYATVFWETLHPIWGEGLTILGQGPFNVSSQGTLEAGCILG